MDRKEIFTLSHLVQHTKTRFPRARVCRLGVWTVRIDCDMLHVFQFPSHTNSSFLYCDDFISRGVLLQIPFTHQMGEERKEIGDPQGKWWGPVSLVWPAFSAAYLDYGIQSSVHGENHCMSYTAFGQVWASCRLLLTGGKWKINLLFGIRVEKIKK